MSLHSAMPPSVSHPGLLRGNPGFLIAIASAILLAFTAIIIRMLTEDYHMPTFVLAFWRAALVALVLLPVLLLFKPQWAKLQLSQVPYYAGYGLLLALFNSLWTLSIALNGASVATILSYCSVGFTVILGWWLYQERLTLREFAVIALSLAGCYLVSQGEGGSGHALTLLGLSVGIITGVGSSLYALGGRVATERRYPVWNTILYVFGFSALYQLVFNLLLTLFPLPFFASMTGDLLFLSQGTEGIQWRAWWLLLLLSAGPTLMGFGLYNLSLKSLPLAIANVILSLELVFTAIIAFFMLNERMLPVQWLGSGLVMVGVLLLGWRRKAKAIKLPTAADKTAAD